VPTLYIIAGSNGAGKSSAGPHLFPQSLIEKHPPFDGDKLKSLKQLEFRKQAGGSYKEAGRLADEFVDQAFNTQYKFALHQNQDFVYEGHFKEEDSWNLIRTFRNNNYKINMLFMGLSSVEISMDRVMQRAYNGGHNVPLYEIERNYYGNLYKLNQHFDLIDHLVILDSSEELAIHLATGNNEQITLHLPPAEMPAWFTQYLPDIYHRGLKT